MSNQAPRLPITEAAVEVTCYERSEPFQPSGEVRLGQGFADPGRVSLFAAPANTATIRNFKINDVYLDTRNMLLIKDGRKIPETGYLVLPGDFDFAHILYDQLVQLDGQVEYITGCNLDHGYYHWLIQAVPAIDWGMRSRSRADTVLLVPQLNAWQTASIDLLGYGDAPRLQLSVDSHYFCPTISYSEFLNETMPTGISRAAQSTFQRLRNAVGDRAEPRTPIIYVARTDTTRRVAINEPELVDALTKEGVHIVVPGGLSFAEQIALFKQADAVLGPHGAGLANFVFCQPGAIVYELFPEHYLNPCYSHLAYAAGLAYWADIFPAHGEGTGHDRNWVIDIGVVMDRLRSIRMRLAELSPTRIALGGSSGAMAFLKRNASAAAAADIRPDIVVPRAEEGVLSRLLRRARS